VASCRQPSARNPTASAQIVSVEQAVPVETSANVLTANAVTANVSAGAAVVRAAKVPIANASTANVLIASVEQVALVENLEEDASVRIANATIANVKVDVLVDLQEKGQTVNAWIVNALIASVPTANARSKATTR